MLIWVNVSCHHPKAVRCSAADLEIELLYLPPFSPDLMPVERLWPWLRQELTALHCHRDEQELCNRVVGFEAQLNDESGAVHSVYAPNPTWIMRKKNSGFDLGRGLASIMRRSHPLGRRQQILDALQNELEVLKCSSIGLDGALI